MVNSACNKGFIKATPKVDVLEMSVSFIYCYIGDMGEMGETGK